MSVSTYKELIEHKDHEIVLAYYGDPEDPANVGIECSDCCEVLYSQNNPAAAEEDDPGYAKQAGGASFETLCKHIECDGVKLLVRKNDAQVRCVDCDTILLRFGKE